EKEARENTLKSLNDYFDVMDEVTRNEWLSMYLNSILEQFDPHTNYLAPDDKQRFDESMSGSMEGIGAQLRKKNDYVEITEIRSEKEARENTLKSLNDYFDVMDEVTRNEWLSMYLNSILEQFDPHTNYLAPDDKQRFDESMSGSMEGIGAQLRKKNDYVEITEIIPGGPAWKANELENGDIIIKVAQGDEEPVDIAGMRLDNVVKLIKGKKDTVV